ncbi:hypothetical protein [Terriglobus albidus]|uniref:hypothetical protein n=1 Tax=Terriglobus albidus TaxID=1592106 RepID=UPI0021E03196|nr:hypothetical protein [Terriglobus albidus]
MLRMHRENLDDRAKDREAVTREMKAQRDELMALLTKREAEHVELKQRVETESTLLRFVAGDGSEGNQGWIGEIRSQVEQLKQFRWQLIAGGATLLLVLDKVWPLVKGH